MPTLSTLFSSLAQSPAVANALPTIGVILVAMAAIAIVEVLIPLHPRGRWSWEHLVPNLGLTLITFATNFVFNAALLAALIWTESVGFGILHMTNFGLIATIVIVVLALDFAFYVSHVAMHEIPGFWRYHRVHHSDPAVDVTTTIRQHPGESVIRYTFLAFFAIAIGASPVAFAVYRAQSALQGLLEHANVRLPVWVDTLLSFFITSPNMHKIHHARDARFTDRNFGNITSLWDRLFLTFVPAHLGQNIDYGLDGFDEKSQQGLLGLIAMPYREPRIVAEETAA